MTEHTPRTTLTSIAGWKLGRTLGRGAYAHVRHAKHSSGLEAACKILPALHRPRTHPATWDETVDAVEAHKEVVLLKALSGAGLQGVVGLEGVIEEGGWTYVFLALHPKSTSSFPTPWKPNFLAAAFRRLLRTIHAFHLLGVSHEDLKRSNILVDAQNQPVVVDFGFSHFKPERGVVKSLGGTLDYSSPEKAMDYRYDPRANDVWSLGILLTKLLGIPHPYASHHGAEQSVRFRQRLLHATPYFHLSENDMKEGSIGEVLQGMLDRNPRTRWTIPQILAHPFFHDPLDKTRAYRPPPLRLPDNAPSPLPPSVIEDVTFLSYINDGFYLCESLRKIKDRIYGPEPCWEKRWAGMLSNWKQRAEIQLDLVPKTSRVVSASSGARRLGVASQPKLLREIFLSPNIHRDVVVPAKADTIHSGIKHESKPKASSRKPLIGRMKSKDHSSERSIMSSVNAAAQKAQRGHRVIQTPARVEFGRRAPAPPPTKIQVARDLPDLQDLQTELEAASQLPVASTSASKSSNTTEDVTEIGSSSESGERPPLARRVPRPVVVSTGKPAAAKSATKSEIRVKKASKVKKQSDTAPQLVRRSQRLMGIRSLAS